MQRRKDEKREAIMQAAVRMFAKREFHEVRLDDVAAAARIGKGTVYIYFSSKENLYDTIAYEGLCGAVERLCGIVEAAADQSAWSTLQKMIGELVEWAYINPHIFKMMQTASDGVRPRLARKRKELGALYEVVLKRGVRTRELVDTSPALTAQMIPAAIRASIRYGPARLPAKTLAKQVTRIFGHGLRKAAR